MKPHYFIACLALAGCAVPATQTPLNLQPANDAAMSKPMPTAYIAGPVNGNGQFTVILSNGEVLTGNYVTQPAPGIATSYGGANFSHYNETLNDITMNARNGNDEMHCTGTETDTAVNVTCNLSDGSTYQTGAAH